LVQCREQRYEKREKGRGAVIKDGAWFGIRRRYWRGRAAVRTNGYWICAVFPHMILNLPFSPTENAQYFTLLNWI
jgi:hypothetical protein